MILVCILIPRFFSLTGNPPQYDSILPHIAAKSNYNTITFKALLYKFHILKIIIQIEFNAMVLIVQKPQWRYRARYQHQYFR